MLLNGKLTIPGGMSELEVREAVTAMAEKNKVYKTVLRGAGAYRHFIPAVVKSITSREELVTCYTPYQAEISQGVLQGTFEFQTMICELTPVRPCLSQKVIRNTKTAPGQAQENSSVEPAQCC